MAYNLKTYLERPFVMKRDVSSVPLSDTIVQLKAFSKEDKASNTNPETDALTFYMLNHAFSVLRMKYDVNEPIGTIGKVADEYFSKDVAIATARAFYYLLLICTRESRHVHKGNDFHEKLQAKYGKNIKDFNFTINGTGSTGAADYLKTNAPECTLGKFTDSLVFSFYKGKYSGGYGGAKWGKVADCLNDFVWGRTSAEMMMDTVWTLCHNNGPIFNKGMLYSHHSSELVTVLDVQRAGLIPQLIADHKKNIKYISVIKPIHIDLYDRIVPYMPEEFGGYIDWDVVELLGSNHKYNHFKQTQKANYGQTTAQKEQLEKALQAEAAKNQQLKHAQEQAAKQAAEEANKKYWFITPTQKVDKFERQSNKATA